jgi:hypothetical protein
LLLTNVHMYLSNDPNSFLICNIVTDIITHKKKKTSNAGLANQLRLSFYFF